MTTFMKNIKDVLNIDVNNESGELPANLLWHAMWIIAALAGAGWLTSAFLGKTADISTCLTTADAYQGSGADDCADNQGRSGDAQDKNEDTKVWKDRFGN